MLRSFVAMATLLGCGTIAGCVGSSMECIPEGTSIAVTRADAAGACPAAVVTGVMNLNGSDSFTSAKAYSCGVTKFKQNFNVAFVAADGTTTTCMAQDSIMFQDLTATGDTGPDTVTLTCSDGTSCTETFNITWTPQ